MYEKDKREREDRMFWEASPKENELINYGGLLSKIVEDRNDIFDPMIASSTGEFKMIAPEHTTERQAELIEMMKQMCSSLPVKITFEDPIKMLFTGSLEDYDKMTDEMKAMFEPYGTRW
jgi:hypothetical protein